MLIKSEWHTHSEYSYDASNLLEDIGKTAQEQGLLAVGITDHLNYNDKSFIGNLKDSAKGVKEAQKKYPLLVLGVELTPIAKPLFDYIAKNGTRDGYEAPLENFSDKIELGLSKEELISLGVRYAVGGAHWRVDSPISQLNKDMLSTIKEWFRLQMFLSQDERVTVLAHPWYNGAGDWYQDFSVIPKSMNDEIFSALKQNGKYMECNSYFFNTDRTGEKFRRQYAEFLRSAFEYGVNITYGSDSHKCYGTDSASRRLTTEKYLREVGFKDGDISQVTKFWG